MRIAVASNGKNISSDFSKTLKLVIFEVIKGRARGKLMIDVSASGGDDALKYILRNEGVEILLCGVISDEIKIGLEKEGIKVISGVRGNINSALSGYMRNQVRKG